MTTWTLAYVTECWLVLCEAAPFALFGFLVAGLLKALMPEGHLARHLGGRGVLPVLKAAALGVPLPLCSCGVLPAALGLRRQGAGPGATTAFMIATPETGVDSLAVTYAMIDPLMTALRPLAALVTAVVAGVASNLLPERLTARPVGAAYARGLQTAAPCSCGGACRRDSRHAPAGMGGRLREGLADAFGDMLADVGLWLLLGILAAAAISLWMPPSLLADLMGGEWRGMLAMLVVGVPLYVCASSSTPIAASLLLKGLSPGAALVFLLTGPATNVATLTVMARSFGPAATAVYLAAIAGCALVFGHVANLAYAGLGLDVHAVAGQAGELLPQWVGAACAAALLLLVARARLLHVRAGSH
jgi:uncharacterized membrane protein YraQ (UPF0718 family)